MKKIVQKTGRALLVATALYGNVTAQKAPASHVVLVTIDGLRPEFYLDSTYGMMNVRQLMKNGVAAKGVDPVFPSVTYPDHKKIKTGFVACGPGLHKGVVIPNMQLLDVTPLTVQLTGISFPKTEGQLYKQMLLSAEPPAL